MYKGRALCELENDKENIASPTKTREVPQTVEDKKKYCEDEDKGGEAERFHCPYSVAGPSSFSAEPKRLHATLRIPARLKRFGIGACSA